MYSGDTFGSKTINKTKIIKYKISLNIIQNSFYIITICIVRRVSKARIEFGAICGENVANQKKKTV